MKELITLIYALIFGIIALIAYAIMQIKLIGLNSFPSSLKIKITGKSTSRDMSYTMDGFIPNEQIYSSLILQNYAEDSNLSTNKKILR